MYSGLRVESPDHICCDIVDDISIEQEKQKSPRGRKDGPQHLTKRVLQFSFTALSVFQIACASFVEANQDKYVRKVTRGN